MRSGIRQECSRGKAWALVFSLVLTLASINWVTVQVVEANAFAGLYPPDSDSLSIPTFGTWLLTLVSAPLSLLIVWLVSSNLPRRFATTSNSRKTFLLGLLASLHLIGILIVLGLIAVWADADHWQIAASYILLLVWLTVTAATAIGGLVPSLRRPPTAPSH